MKTKHNLLRNILRGSAVGVAAAVLSLILWFSGATEGFEYRLWDFRQRLMAKPGKATEEIVVILLDQNSLDWAKEENGLSWPWPREVYTYIINFVARSNPRALAFDVLYTEPSTYGVYDDESLGRSIKEFKKFVGALFLGETTGNAERWPADITYKEIKIKDIDEYLQRTGREEFEYPRATFPIPEVANNSEYLSNVNLKPDSDGIFRRAKLFTIFDGKVIPSMALALYMTGREESSITVSEKSDKINIDGYKVPLDSESNAILNFRGPSGSHLTYSAAAVIQSEIQILSGESPRIDPSIFKDKYVLFGFSAPGLLDLRPTPVSSVYAGVEVHATMLDNLLSGDFKKPLNRIHTIAIFILLAVFAGVAVSITTGVVKNIIVYLFFLPIPLALSIGFYTTDIWFPAMDGEISVIFALAGAGIVNYATEGKQKRYIKNAFRQYLSPAVIEELIANPDRLKLGGEKRELTIFFSDVQGFTSVSEILSPEELTSLLNDYLSAMTDIIQEEGGTVDKYEGDAIIAFWNAPLDQEDHALRGVRAALRCQRELSRLRPVFKERVGKDLFMRIGMNTGPAVVGNMGSHTRFDYTMLGDAVNLAARLEGINKQFGSYTLVSRSTIEKTDGAFPAREVSRVAVVGRKEPVTVYEPMFPEDFERNKVRIETFHSGLKYFYEGRFSEAMEVFSNIKDEDHVASSYLAKCREMAESPPENWDGVWVMTSK